jgi:hypothetical protein
MKSQRSRFVCSRTYEYKLWVIRDFKQQLHNIPVQKFRSCKQCPNMAPVSPLPTLLNHITAVDILQTVLPTPPMNQIYFFAGRDAGARQKRTWSWSDFVDMGGETGEVGSEISQEASKF